MTQPSPLTHVDPMADPASAQALVDEALRAAPDQPQYVEPERTLKPLPVTSVRLPAGYLLPDGSVEYDVEVRELNGEDEEALAKSPSTARALMTILTRATVRIGDTKATADLLDGMLAGDREAVLLQIRKATYGTTEEFKVVCHECEAEQVLTVDLDTDVEVKKLDDPMDRFWTVDLRAGEAKLSLPDGRTHKKIAASGENKTLAELNTIVISECLHKVGGNPSLGTGTARSLGLADRQKIVDEIAKRQPGPQLAEVVKKCESCAAEIPLPLSLAYLFRL